MEASVINQGGFHQSFSTGALLRLRSDEQLLKLFREGNEEAFEVIFDRYRPRLLTYLKRMLGRSGIDAEDVLQDVFCKAYDSLRADRREIAVKPWLYRVAHNRSIDHLRRPQLDPEQILATTRGVEIDPPTCVEQRDELRGLVASIGALPPQRSAASAGPTTSPRSSPSCSPTAPRLPRAPTTPPTAAIPRSDAGKNPASICARRICARRCGASSPHLHLSPVGKRAPTAS